MVAVMDCETQGSEERFRAYVEALAEVIGHADREQPLRDYCVGLLMPCERKSVEPMAALVAPSPESPDYQTSGFARRSARLWSLGRIRADFDRTLRVGRLQTLARYNLAKEASRL